MSEEVGQGDPGHSIPITPQVLAREAALQRERERQQVSPAQAWREKLQLNPDNLRTVPVAAAAPGRVADTRRVAVPRDPHVRHSGRYCAGEGCERELSVYTLGSLCRKCFWAAKRAQPKPATPATPKRLCITGCGCAVRRSSETGVCAQCAARERRSGKKMARVPCDGGCGKLLRAGRLAGYCHRCGWNEAVRRCRSAANAQQARYKLRRTRRQDKHCKVCDVLLHYLNTSGACRKHAPQIRSEQAQMGMVA